MTVVQPPPSQGTLSAEFVADPVVWDRAIDVLGGSLLQSWRWGDLKARHGWSHERVLLGARDAPRVVAQVLLRPMGPFRVAYVPRGPAAAADLSRCEMAELTVALDRLARLRRAAIVLLEPDTHALPVAAGGSLGWTPSSTLVQPRRTIKVPIECSDEALLAQMKPKTRYNVRLAQRRGVTVRLGGVADVTSFYRLLAETALRDEFGIHGVEYYRDMLGTFGADAALLIAEYDDDPAAAVLVVRHGPEAIYMYGASSRAHQRHMAAYLLQYTGMRWARDAGCRRYDLWGLPESDEAPDETADNGGNLNVRNGLWGVYRFKQGFGGDVIDYPGVVERIYLPPLVWVWRRLRLGLR